MVYKDKEKQKEYQKKYRLKNKDRLKKYDKKYSNSENGKKLRSIQRWKQRGILCFDFNLLYDIFFLTKRCEFCNYEFDESNKKCLDHDHSIKDKFNVRGVLCNYCNFEDVFNCSDLNNDLIAQK